MFDREAAWKSLTAAERKALKIIFRAGDGGATGATSNYDEHDRPRVRAQCAKSLEKKGYVLGYIPRYAEGGTFKHYIATAMGQMIVPLDLLLEVKLAEAIQRVIKISDAEVVRVAGIPFLVRGDERVRLP